MYTGESHPANPSPYHPANPTLPHPAQIVIGYIGDRPAMNSLTLYAVLTAVAGIATTCMPLTTSYGQLAAVCSAYGAFISANYSLTTIILVDLVGMSRLTSAYGVVMFSQGIANLVGPPAAGYTLLTS